jgi:hypothetical protein
MIDRVVLAAKGSMKAVAGSGKHEHVGGVDRLPAADRRAVEAEALGEDLLGQFGDRNGKMLPGPVDVAELEVDDFDVLGFGQGENFFGSHNIKLRPSPSIPDAKLGPPTEVLRVFPPLATDLAMNSGRA